jgi:hypothetical protein
LAGELPRPGGIAEELPELSRQHHERDAVHVTDQDRPGEEVRKEAEPAGTGRYADDAGQKGQDGQNGEGARGVVASGGGEARRDEKAGRGVLPDDELAGRPEDSVGKEREDRRIEPTIAGTPTRSAQAMPTGRATAATDRPAMRWGRPASAYRNARATAVPAPAP